MLTFTFGGHGERLSALAASALATTAGGAKQVAFLHAKLYLVTRWIFEAQRIAVELPAAAKTKAAMTTARHNHAATVADFCEPFATSRDIVGPLRDDRVHFWSDRLASLGAKK
jgi:hypothetical protein